MPIFLWSTVVNHDQNPLVVVAVGRRSMPRRATAASRTLVAAISGSPPSLQLLQVCHEVIDLRLGEPVVGHERPGLLRRRAPEPRGELLRISVLEHTAGEAV